jgi:hypothetical protein
LNEHDRLTKDTSREVRETEHSSTSAIRIHRL